MHHLRRRTSVPEQTERCPGHIQSLIFNPWTNVNCLLCEDVPLRNTAVETAERRTHDAKAKTCRGRGRGRMSTDGTGITPCTDPWEECRACGGTAVRRARPPRGPAPSTGRNERQANLEGAELPSSPRPVTHDPDGLADSLSQPLKGVA